MSVHRTFAIAKNEDPVAKVTAYNAIFGDPAPADAAEAYQAFSVLLVTEDPGDNIFITDPSEASHFGCADNRARDDQDAANQPGTSQLAAVLGLPSPDWDVMECPNSGTPGSNFNAWLNSLRLYRVHLEE